MSLFILLVYKYHGSTARGERSSWVISLCTIIHSFGKVIEWRSGHLLDNESRFDFRAVQSFFPNTRSLASDERTVVSISNYSQDLMKCTKIDLAAVT